MGLDCINEGLKIQDLRFPFQREEIGTQDDSNWVVPVEIHSIQDASIQDAS